MAHIKKFQDYINEELDSETYMSASRKLRKQGHITRADQLAKHSYDTNNFLEINDRDNNPIEISGIKIDYKEYDDYKIEVLEIYLFIGHSTTPRIKLDIDTSVSSDDKFTIGKYCTGDRKSAVKLYKYIIKKLEKEQKNHALNLFKKYVTVNKLYSENYIDYNDYKDNEDNAYKYNED